MPPKRGKRGRPKKAKEVEADEEAGVAESEISSELDASIEADELGDNDDDVTAAAVKSIMEHFDDEDNQTIGINLDDDQCKPTFLQSENITQENDLVVIRDDAESADMEEILKHVDIKHAIESVSAKGKVQVASTRETELVDKDVAKPVAKEDIESATGVRSIEPITVDDMESMVKDLNNIDNMESMENDEALDFKGLEDVDSCRSLEDNKMDVDLEAAPSKVEDGGGMKYDPSMVDISEDLEIEPEQELKKGESGTHDESNDMANKFGLDPETETVSEDELPSETTKPPSDTEAVSDEELPPNNSADALLDTEAVSEDELPPLKKKKLDAEDQKDTIKKMSSMEEESHQKASLKRPSTNVESTDGAPSSAKKSSVESKPPSKALMELEKYWKAVKEDPSDFTGWTYLLQYVDQGQDVEAAREAYDAFLSHYPYCYGYWRKYADYEKKKGDKSKSQDVFERGLAAIPLSVDLWLHYLNHIKNSRKDEEDYIREQYNRAIDVCGIEFRSDRLWDSYIKWETECKNVANVFEIYDRLLSVPTQGYKGHFENFVDFVKTNQPNKMLNVDEFLTIRSEILQKLKQKGGTESVAVASAPPGDESDDETEKSPNFADEETKLMRDKIISLRTKSFKTMSNAVLDRWSFEEGIKRPYFHVKPLERCQLNNWRSYLDYEIGQGDKQRVIVLFERCLIACALYDEFWVKYVKYLETLPENEVTDKIRDVYERACTIHHTKKPMLSLSWASFEENKGNVDGARKILIRLEKEVPNSLQISINRINLERRAKNHDEVSKLYEYYINSNKNKFAMNALSIKYARFCQKILNDIDKGSEVLKKAIEKDRDNPRLHHQLLDLVFSKTPRLPEHEEECVNIINQFLERDSSDLEHKLLFAQHKVEFLEDFGSCMSSVQKAVIDYMNLLKQVKEKRRKQFEEKIKTEDKKTTKIENTPHAASTPSNGSTTNYQTPYPSSQQPPYQNSSNQYQQQQQQPPSNYSQQPPYSQYNSQSDPNYNNYQNWNYQQTTGYNNYNQGWGSYNYY